MSWRNPKMKKKNLKKLLCLTAAFALCLALAACSGGTGDTQSSDTGSTAPSDTGGDGGDAGNAEEVKIGIIQLVNHPSLNNCYEGTIQGLAEAGYVDGENGVTIDTKVADGKSETTDMMAKTMVSSGYDMIIAIATPAAMSAYSAARDAGIPVIYSAVSDPISAGLAKDLDDPQTGASGTKDALNLEGQMQMIRALLPEAETIGILYTTSEPNSVSAIAEYEALAGDYGFVIESVGVTAQSEVAQAADTLIARGVDCFSNLTDNNVVGVLASVLEKTNEAGIPVYGSEVEQVKLGCVASAGIEYFELGRRTGAMAASILLGEATCQDLPYETIRDYDIYINSQALAELGIQLPEDVASQAVEAGQA